MLVILRIYYHAQAMRPGLVGLLVDQSYLARQRLYGTVERLGAWLAGLVLDVGCGDRPYEKLVGARAYVGLRLDTRESRARGKADAYYDGHSSPFQAGAFGAVMCDQVLEKHRFRLLQRRKSAADVRALFQLASAYLYKVTATRSTSTCSLRCC